MPTSTSICRLDERGPYPNEITRYSAAESGNPESLRISVKLPPTGCYDTDTMSKLTLSVDPAVIAQAKRYAKQNSVSLSKIVEAYLAAVTAPVEVTNMPPVLRSLRGILKAADPEDYKRHLARKYL